MRLVGNLPSISEVLIVNDDPVNVAIVERMLMRNGFTGVRSLTDPLQFRDAFVAQRPDIILLDLQMAHLSGLDVIAETRRLCGTNEYLPILAITGDVTSDTHSRALAAGAIDFITKPFDEAEVVLRVLNYLEVRRLHLRLVVRATELEYLVQTSTAKRPSWPHVRPRGD